MTKTFDVVRKVYKKRIFMLALYFTLKGRIKKNGEFPLRGWGGEAGEEGGWGGQQGLIFH